MENWNSHNCFQIRNTEKKVKSTRYSLLLFYIFSGILVGLLFINASIRQIRKVHTTPEMFKIIFYGDSITETASWKNGFIEYVNQQNVRKADIVNRGFSGYTSRELKLYLAPITYGIYADLSFLMIGTNDARISSDTRKCTVDEYVANVNFLVDKLDQHSKDLYLVTPPPTFDNIEHEIEHTILYRNALILIGSKRDIPVIDNWEFITFEDLKDGIHLNDKGNLKMAIAFQKVIDHYNLKRFLP